MQILLVSPRQCWPALTGAKLREYYLARGIGAHADLTHVSFRENGPPMSSANLPFCRRILSVPRAAAYSPMKVVRGVLGRWPLPILNYSSDQMRETLTALLREQHFDLVHLEGIHMAGYSDLFHERGIPAAFNWHNIESELMYRYSRNNRSLLHKAYARTTAARLAEIERTMLREAWGHIVCSERECAQLQQIAPQARIAVVANGVEISSNAEHGKPLSERNRVVFVGSMNYHANVEAACLFTREVWPMVRDRFPGWHLTLVGSNPAQAVQELAAEKNVEVTGTVPDVRPYYDEAIAAIVPLRTGGGTRLKILEAMAAGVPVISTALGAEGLAGSSGNNILIADKNEEWLPHLVQLSTDLIARERIVSAARELVASNYDWNALGDSLFETYRRWLEMR